MIEVGTSENHVAVYRGEVTPEGYRCAVEIACGGLLGLYEPAWFAPGDVALFARETDSVIAGRRSAARIATVRTSPRLTFTLMPLGANYQVRVRVERPSEGEGVDVEPATLYVSIPHESLMMAYRDVRYLVPEVPAAETEEASRTVDLSWDGDNGCWLTLPSLSSKRDYVAVALDMIELDCRLVINGVEDTLRDVAFFPEDLRRFANALRDVEQSQISEVALSSMGREFELELSVERRNFPIVTARVTLHARDYTYLGKNRDRYEEKLMGRFPLGGRKLEEARQTLEAWLGRLGGER